MLVAVIEPATGFRVIKGLHSLYILCYCMFSFCERFDLSIAVDVLYFSSNVQSQTNNEPILSTSTL